jgi:hypothetical protein
MTWLTDRQRHGGIDAVEVPTGGTIWLCGKHLIGPDPEEVLTHVGAGALWCLTEEHELVDRYPDYTAWLRRDVRARWQPVYDLGVAPLDTMRAVVSGVVADLDLFGSVVVHCGAGLGRAGTVAVLTLMSAGCSASEAQQIVASSRPGAGPESGAQADLVEGWKNRGP